MRRACCKLVGDHDFRNLCKMDVGNGVTVFRRQLKSADIQPVNTSQSTGGYTMYALTIEANAFLWHQIRCIMAVLLLIGEGKETPEVIDELLDTDKNPRKPQYALASELPLVLFDCDFDGVDWQYDMETLNDLVQHMQAEWTKHSIRATMTRAMLGVLESEAEKLHHEEDTPQTSTDHQAECLLVENKCKVYKPLMERNKCESLEERLAYYSKRRKLEPNKNAQDDVTSSDHVTASDDADWSTNQESESS